MKNYDILDVQNMVTQGNAAILESLNNTIAQAIEKSNVQVENRNSLTSGEINNLIAFLRSRDRQMGIGTAESRSKLTEIERDMRDSIEGGFTIGFDAFRAKMDQEYNKMIMKSQKGKDGPLNFESAKAKNNDEAKSLKKEYSKDLTKENEKIADKIIGFFKGKEASDDEKGKKNRKNFIADFIEELGKVPTLGGALMDLVKLVTYVGATYLKQFGTLGRVIGAALVIFGPTLAGLLGKAIIGGLGKLSLGAMGKAGGAIGLGAMAVNEWKNGSKGAGAMFGLASAAMGAALVPALAPIAVPVAAIATGIGLIIKFHKQIGEWFKDVLKKLGIIAKDSDDIPSSGTAPSFTENIGFGPTGTYRGDNVGKRKSISKTEWEKANTANLQLNAYGAVTNFGKMTKERAWDWMTAYEQEYPKEFSKLYKRYNKKDYGDLIDFASFNTDLSNKDKSEVILGTGVLEDFAKRKEYLRKQGYDVSAMKITSGIGTAGSYATKTTSPHNLTGTLQSHNSILGGTYDMGIIKDKSGNTVSAKDLNKIFRQSDLGELPTLQQEADHYHVSMQKTQAGSKAAETYAKNSAELMKIDKELEAKKAENNKKATEKARKAAIERGYTQEEANKIEQEDVVGNKLAEFQASRKKSKLMSEGVDISGNEFYSKILLRMNALHTGSADITQGK